MANFTYEASGRLCMSSWVSYKLTKVYRTKYRERDTLYSRKKAIRGVLELVVIKRIEYVSNVSTGGQVMPLYVDTYNAYWREDMLIEQDDAVSLAQNFYLLRIAEGEDILKANGNSCLP